MNRIHQILIAFILGQALQLALHCLGNKIASTNPLLICIVVGILVAIAFYIGVSLATREQNVTNLPLEEVFGDEIKTD